METQQLRYKNSHRARMERVISGEAADRVPVALWRHFPVDDQTPENLAAATLDFQKSYDFDFVKVTPASSYCLKDWGIKDEWTGAVEGTRDYVSRVIHTPEDWLTLPLLDPYSGKLAAQIICLKRITSELGASVPVIQTIFNPLSQAKNLVGKEKLLYHMRSNPQALAAGLRTIAESTQLFMDAARDTGIAGFFYAVQHAQYHLLSLEEYHEFGRIYDLELLTSVDDMWLNILHLHGNNIMFKAVMDYPVSVINWHDRDTAPTLKDGLVDFRGVVCGGLRREQSMVLGSPTEVTAEALDAINSTGGKRFILGTGCVVPITAPRANLIAARQSVELTR